MENFALELAKSAGFVWLLIIGVAALVFNAGIAYTQFRYMRTSMITKKDMEIALLEFQQEMQKEFVTRRECEHLGITKQPRGGHFQ